ncbi:alpha-1,2-mannosidase, putative subfamily [Thozetella sp. PMI_491]|nr:alpha-1,2-mannosidase, putative subfamily [Thozetella sp. PMI_491]
MGKFLAPVAAALLLGILQHAQGAENAFDVLDFVDPLIGTTNGGHVFPGATLPFGMAKAVADVDQENQAGYSTGDGNIIGFSHMHDDGTGGGASLGNFPIFPQTGCPGDDLNRCQFTRSLRAVQRINETVTARPGYFGISLNTSVYAEMTVSNRTALYRFTFPGGATAPKLPANVTAPAAPDVTYSPLILADTNDISNTRQNASISVDGETGRIRGTGTFVPSFGVGYFTLSFCADFSGAEIRDTGVFMNNRAANSPKSLKVQNDGVSDPAVPAGAWVQFHPPANDQILVRVGVSFISEEQACKNAEAEIPGFDFDATRTVAEESWREKLGVISIDYGGVDELFYRAFWSGAYRAMISPQDYTGENPLWSSTEPYYDSFYCIWDSFRTIHPLLTILDPHSQTLMIRALIDIYRFEGKLPDCRMSLCKGFTQGGSNADIVLADAYLKGLTNGIDWDKGYEAVGSDAEDEPALWSIEGRGGLRSWKELGYIPTDDFDPYGTGPFTRSISRTVEYAYNDFCIAEMARGLGHDDDAEKYLSRSGNWKNMFNAEQTSKLNLTGSEDPADLVDSPFTGFLQPRYLNGTFGYQDPSFCTPMNNFDSCYLNADGHETYEGSCWLYTFYAPQDMATLIATLGGPETFVSRLEYLHNTPGLLYFGDEQAFLLVYLFHYAGRPGLSAQYAHSYIPSQFNDSIAGIPGNDDSGAMGSFSTLAMMGLFPIAGQDVYVITPPFFKEVNVTNPVTGKTATIRNINFDAAYENIYVQSATLNGQNYVKSWITHSFYRDGGVLELVLGKNESSWGTLEADLPPSASTHF